MTTTLALIASGILIGAGISVIWRDVMRNRRKTPRVRAAARPACCRQRTRGCRDHHPRRPRRASRCSPMRTSCRWCRASRRNRNRKSASQPSRRRPSIRPAPSARRLAAVEQQWANLEPVVAAGVGAGQHHPVGGVAHAGRAGQDVLELQEPRLRRLPPAADGRGEPRLGAHRAGAGRHAAASTSRRTRTPGPPSTARPRRRPKASRVRPSATCWRAA